MEITPQEALDCFASDDLIGIGMEADAVRRALHPENVVTYAVSRTLSLDQTPEHLFAAIEDCARSGDTTVCLDHAAGLGLARIEETLSAIRQRFPSLRLRALYTGHLLAIAESSSLSLNQTLERLHAAGLDSISGDDLCAVAHPGLVPLDRWLDAHRLAHRAGLTSTAGLVFGLGETSEDRVHRLFAIRALQQETLGFTAFTLLSPPPGPSPGATPALERPTAVEYLRGLAIARIVLDNLPSIESNCLDQGLKVTQMSLRFGANDAGSIGPSGTTLKAAFTEEDLRRVIRDAGLTPVERDPLYRTLFLNN